MCAYVASVMPHEHFMNALNAENVLGSLGTAVKTVSSMVDCGGIFVCLFIFLCLFQTFFIFFGYGFLIHI